MPLPGPRIAFAQEAWPSRSVRYVNGFPAGGATDTLSRILCQKMSELSGQSFIVENKGGAGGVLGADAVAKAPPDGYTVGLGGIANNVLAIGSYAKLPYEPRADFTFIGGMWQLPNILSARKDLFSSDLRELLAAFKKEPRKYTYASAGFGTTLHLSGEMMNSMAGVEVTHIPYKGAGPALTDLLGGRVDLLFDNLPGSLPSVRAGQIKPVAVTARARIRRASGRADHGGSVAGICDDLMDRDDWTDKHEGRSCGASECSCRQGTRRSCFESALCRPWCNALANLAGGDQGIPRQRGSTAIADHEGGRDQAGVKPLRSHHTLGFTNLLSLAPEGLPTKDAHIR